MKKNKFWSFLQFLLWVLFLSVSISACVSAPITQELRHFDYDGFGIVFNTTVSAGMANVHEHPSLQSEILFQVQENTRIRIVGMSREKDTIGGFSGHWLLIYIRADQPYASWDGWIFGGHVNVENLRPNEISIIGLAPEEPRRARHLLGTYKSGDREIQFSVLPHKRPDQPFWTFVWDFYNENYRYDTIPGSYIWYPETNELRHISHIGHTETSAWVMFTDDFKYLIHDFGTSPGPRGVVVWRTENGENVFSGTYLRDIRLNGHTIEIAYLYNEWTMDDLDAEIIAFAEDFIINNPEPDAEMLRISQETGLVPELIVFCDFNMDTGIRRITRAVYILVQ